ncbi:cupredoxin domain-containing protein [Sulfuritalea sp.]|uniref:cupredoxin domain-containing protein n=1 Tax=Sulfuritalea sp. TaxID=2480090 RepID=UPI00286DAE4B|nr:cupredoxin domain-containing protein [Sulfuritalea sp.]
MLPVPVVRVAFILTLWFGLGWATAPRAQTPPAEAVTFDVVIKNGRIVPARLEVPAGRKIKLAIKNEGPGPSEFENLSLRVEKVLAPGASSFLVIHPLKPGSYRFIDEFHPDTSEMLLIAK